MKLYIHLFYLIFIVSISCQQAWIRFGTTNCVKSCFQDRPTAFFCSHSRTNGFCCPDASRVECQTNETNEVYCSQNANFQNVSKYAFCPRNTTACGPAGPVLRPLLNQNQSLFLRNTMTGMKGQSCYWEFQVNTTAFEISHGNIPLDQVQINIDLIAFANLTVYIYQGNDRWSGTNLTNNVTTKKSYKFFLSDGQSVFLIAYPTNLAQYQNTLLNLTYNYTTDYYTNKGVNYDFVEDMAPPGFWNFVIVGFSLGVAIIVAILMGICCKEFDPLSDFEVRRRDLAREKRKQVKKQASNVKGGGDEHEDDGLENFQDEMDELDEVAIAKASNKNSKQNSSKKPSPNKKQKINQDDEGPVSQEDIQIELSKNKGRDISPKTDKKSLKFINNVSSTYIVKEPSYQKKSSLKMSEYPTTTVEMQNIKSPSRNHSKNGRSPANKGVISFGGRPIQPAQQESEDSYRTAQKKRETIKFNVVQKPKKVNRNKSKDKAKNPFEDDDY